ncbi:hypothetical protein ACH0CV_06560 [Brachybacterium paraconglomeratum]|uniref:hypothetical protein n=1 Tax=Brachybacterium paraconglomeratum TaxID=173362 RepID=UPI003878F9E7
METRTAHLPVAGIELDDLAVDDDLAADVIVRRLHDLGEDALIELLEAAEIDGGSRGRGWLSGGHRLRRGVRLRGGCVLLSGLLLGHDRLRGLFSRLGLFGSHGRLGLPGVSGVQSKADECQGRGCQSEDAQCRSAGTDVRTPGRQASACHDDHKQDSDHAEHRSQERNQA